MRTLKPVKLIAALAAALTLGACVNDGTVADKHVITFERSLPDVHPSKAELEEGLRSWIIQNFADGAAAKDISLGPVRYAKLLIPFPDTDFFSCVQYTAKNQYGTFIPPVRQLTAFRNYDDGRGYVVSLVKLPGTGAYDQYCISQPHS